MRCIMYSLSVDLVMMIIVTGDTNMMYTVMTDRVRVDRANACMG